MKKKMFVVMGFLLVALIVGLVCIHIRNKNDVVRFGVIADTHVVESDSAGRIKEALETFKEISPDIDGVLMCGDIVFVNHGVSVKFITFNKRWISTLLYNFFCRS